MPSDNAMNDSHMSLLWPQPTRISTTALVPKLKILARTTGFAPKMHYALDEMEYSWLSASQPSQSRTQRRARTWRFHSPSSAHLFCHPIPALTALSSLFPWHFANFSIRAWSTQTDTLANLPRPSTLPPSDAPVPLNGFIQSTPAQVISPRNDTGSRATIDDEGRNGDLEEGIDTYHHDVLRAPF
ncbi:hypothetical protein C8F01DRAFT_1254226 [Mycena amicta]|nr:hypothetical protein C8F01DRAFT_1254226 [Mycena amicta]